MYVHTYAYTYAYTHLTFGQAGTAGEGYCADGHNGAMCEGCSKANTYYDEPSNWNSVSAPSCEPCGTAEFWLSRVLEYAAPIGFIAAILIFCNVRWA